MLNRTKAHHDLNWSNNRPPVDSIPWHHEEQQPARRGRLTTLEALQLIRRRYEATLRESVSHTEHATHSYSDLEQREQQAA